MTVAPANIEIVEQPAAGAAEGAAEGGLALRGALTVDTVPGLWKQSLRLFGAQRKSLSVDLAGVDPVDSAGLALLIAWQARALQSQLTLRYTAVPERLLNLARISEVDALLLSVA